MIDFTRDASTCLIQCLLISYKAKFDLKPSLSLSIELHHKFLKAVPPLQVSRSIGDVYLKKAEFNREPLYAKFRLREPIKRPILSSEPSISVHQLQPHDQFIIFASDGLWEHLSNQEAVDIVQNSPRSVRYIFKIKLY